MCIAFYIFTCTLPFQFSGLKTSLPDNVQILTLEPWKAWSYLLRLEHVYEKGEDKVLSKPVTVDLKASKTMQLHKFVHIQRLTSGLIYSVQHPLVQGNNCWSKPVVR